jgi:hypothetical protein
MDRAARTPEELDTLLEDAFVLRDADALLELFEPAAVLAIGAATRMARGAQEIVHLVTWLWEQRTTYLAGQRQVMQARDTALMLGDRDVAVVRRGTDGHWRIAISVLDSLRTKEERDGEDID